MKILAVILTLVLTGCSTWSPIREVTLADGSTMYWLNPLPSGTGSAWAPSAQVNTYQGTVNGHGYSVQTFGRGR